MVEILVVLGIIAILMATLIPSFGYVLKIARQARAQELVSNAATALTIYIQRERAWADEMLESRGYFNQKVCFILVQAGLLDVTSWRVIDNENLKFISDSPDKFGLLDPWGQAMLKRNKEWLEMDELPEGHPLRNHLLQFRIDSDFNGFVDNDDRLGNVPMDKPVRASAIVWSPGPSGDPYEWTVKGRRYPKEHRLSWGFER